MSNRPIVVVCAVIGSAVAGAVITHAGPLDPPAGPVASTYKTLGQVEPRTEINLSNTPGDATSVYKITKSGSYYLTGNLKGAAGKDLLLVDASSVTIDLMGFTLDGGGSSSLRGITAGTNTFDICLRNGTITNCGSTGVELLGDGGSLEGVRALINSGLGIWAPNNCVIRACAAENNTFNGFLTGLNSTIEDCVSRNNGTNGFNLGSGTTMVGCAARTNIVGGISAGSNCIIRACTASGHTALAIAVGQACSVIDCSLNGNTGGGIAAQGGCLIRGNIIVGSLSSNTVQPPAGIWVSSTDCVVQDNVCIGNSRGLRVTSTGSFIARNRCTGNTINWDIVVGNAVAPIVSATTNAAAISGNTYSGSLGSTDPSANFSY